MGQIQILDSETIDKIAAGEVVERPSSVVKELVENAMDAGAGAITVEIKEGGISFIRVSDNGSGMEKGQLSMAFLRHATSKIRRAADLTHVASLGFRGEALSSIAAVSQVEVITKTAGSLTGVRLVLEGSVEKDMEEVGAPDGTTFLVRNLFFNTPVRRKFLKTAATEGGYVIDLMEHLALSRPDISFKFLVGTQTRFHTSGNGNLKEVIYRIYGRDIANSLIPIREEASGVRIEGYLGKPAIVRSNRNFEVYYINGRFIKSSLIAKAVEEGYKEYLMQHKFPLCVLHISMDRESVDVNVHPTKMDVRFSDNLFFANLLMEAVHRTLKGHEMIPDNVLEDEEEHRRAVREERLAAEKERVPEFFEKERIKAARVMEGKKYQTERPQKQIFWAETESEKVCEPTAQDERPVQMEMFEERLISVSNRSRYQIIGQVFDTYWLVQFEDRLFIIDQHAAHEKVKYERLIKRVREKQVISQELLPPVIVSLTGQEEALLSRYREIFVGLGFEIEEFGGSEYALRGVPTDLYGCSEKELFLAVLDDLAKGVGDGFKAVEEKIASMACKAAVKGNNRLSKEEAEALIDELLLLENPYHCPHGRPTIISMTQTELEKKFKRIV